VVTKLTRRLVRELLETIILAVVLAFILRGFVAETFIVDGYSMEPSLHNGERLLVNKLAYRLGEPERGDIVVFRFPLDPSRDFIKRVIGLPGDEIEVRGNRVFVNGQPLSEDYILPDQDPVSFPNLRVPAGELFVMGDNRGNSDDSRIFGPVKIDLVKGQAMFVYWPFSNFRILP
jgi:signal peptidase I